MNQFIAKLLLALLGVFFSEFIVESQSNDSIKTNSGQMDTIFYPDLGNDSSLWVEPETMPEFPGGDKALFKYIKNNTKYPQLAIKDSIEGRVITKFSITSEGDIGEITVLKGIRDDLNNECKRVIRDMPKWKPGTQLTKTNRGWYWNRVTDWYIIPFTFLLKEKENARGIVILPK